MWVLSSEGHGVEYASKSKQKCIVEMKRLQKDDKACGVDWEKYYIDYDDSDFYKEGIQ